jgi:hypothetical protein
VKKPALWAWLPVAIPILALFGPALATDSSFAMRDAGHFYHPLFEWCGREWAAGRVPLWNPYENCGLPVLADTTSSLFYPGKLVFLLPVDFALRYKLYIVLHVVLAAAGSYSLARGWKCSPAAAAIAAIAYACGGNVVFQYCNVVFLVGAAWLPLAVLTADRTLVGGSWRAAVLLGVVLALMILGGDPQAALHGLLITGLYAVLLRLKKPAAEAHEVVASQPRVGVLHQFLLIASAAVIAYLLAAVQALPSGEATKLSERAAFNRPRNIYEAAVVALQPAESVQPLGETRNESIARGIFCAPEAGSHHDLAYDFSVGPWRLAEYVWPNIGGRMFPTNRRWLSLLPAEGRTWTPTLYLGLLPVILALSVFRLRSGSPRERWLSWLVLLFTLASFGYYGLGWMLQELRVLSPTDGKTSVAPPVGGVYWLFVTFLPTYAYFRYPAKLLPLVSLGLSQLAASGFDRAFVEPRPRLAKVLLVFGIGSGVCAFVVWFVGAGLFSQVIKPDSSLGPFDARGAYHDLLFAFVQTMLVALTCRWLLQKAWAESSPRPAWQTAAVLLTGVELAVANAWLVVIAPADLWRSESPVANLIRETERPADAAPAPPRVYRGNLASWRPPGFRQAGSANRPAETAQWERDTLFPKHELPSGLALVESYGSIKLIDYESLLFVAKQHGPRQPDKTLLPQPTALRLLGTEFLVLPDRQTPDFADLVPAAGEHWPASAALRKMTRTLPRAWIVHEVHSLPPLPRPLRIEAVDQRTKEVLFPGNKARNFLRTAVVETEQPLLEWSQDQTEKSSPASEGPAESCKITHYDPQRVVVTAQLARPGLLVLSDAWFPGWRAVVTTGGSSREAPIYRTNRVLRGVWLPAGTSEIEFRYQPASFVRGAIISGCSWFLLAIGWLINLIRSWGPKPGAKS